MTLLLSFVFKVLLSDLESGFFNIPQKKFWEFRYWQLEKRLLTGSLTGVKYNHHDPLILRKLFKKDLIIFKFKQM